MKIETILEALHHVTLEKTFEEPLSFRMKRHRQYNAFRARIIKMDAEKNATIAAAEKLLKAATTLKIDGWLSDEYDLPDQQALIKAALEYNRVRKMRQL